MARPNRNRGSRRERATRALRALPLRRILKFASIALVSLFIAAGATVAAIANIARGTNPALVAQLTDDPLAPVLALQRQLDPPRRLLANDVEVTARASLRQHAVSSVPLRILAMRAEVLGRRAQARVLLSLSEQVSRRDVLTQLMLIEEAVQANNITAALTHYDKALRTSDESHALLFPVLNEAIGQPAILEAFVPYVRRPAPWMPNFIESSIASGPAGARNAALLLLSANVRDLMRVDGPSLIAALVSGRDFALAQQVFQSMPGADPHVLQSTGFRSNTVDPAYGLISWSAINAGSSGATFEGPRGSDARQVRLLAGSGERVLVLRRLVALPPGQYSHTEFRSMTTGDRSSRAFWEMKCASGETLQSIWRDPADGVSYRLENAPGPRIPNGCTHQILELTVNAGDGQQGLEFVIQRFELSRVGA